jgi:CPA1 family monovalent cation:H+ antiporter
LEADQYFATIALVLCAVFYAGLLYVFQWLVGYPVPFCIVAIRCSIRSNRSNWIKGVLSSIRAPHHLIVKLEGESFNDAMCIALFMTLLKVLQGEHFSLIATIETLFMKFLLQ